MLINVFFTLSCIVYMHVCISCVHGFVHICACEGKRKCSTTLVLKSKDNLGYDFHLPTLFKRVSCSATV